MIGIVLRIIGDFKKIAAKYGSSKSINVVCSPVYILE